MAPRSPSNETSGIYTRTTASERAALAADRARISEIDLRIPELEASLKALQREKQLVQDRLDAYTYPVLSLPSEITSEIFVHFLPAYPKAPPPTGPFSPYQLCQICRQWRDIAVATPALWRTISLSLRETKNVNHAGHLLRTLLERSGSCLLSLELASEENFHWQLAQFGRAITNHSAQLEHLTVYARPLDGFPEGDLSLPYLRTLKLGRGSENSVTTFLAAPLLRKVKLQAYHDTPRSIFPWSQLTVLSVGRIRISSCVYILSQLVNVTTCHFMLDASFESAHVELSHTPVTLPHLETLVLENVPHHLTFIDILDTLTLPALRRLQVPVSLSGPLESLVSRSRCYLEVLCIPNSSPIIRFKYRSTFPSVPTFIFEADGELDIDEPFLL
ncbi:hypothetical protein DFH06DRAFT_1243631 [Mycena polygramma]|nr:hypothetical protein DFH06DRAFT_1243631 [Mycena polygramma]